MAQVALEWLSRVSRRKFVQICVWNCVEAAIQLRRGESASLRVARVHEMLSLQALMLRVALFQLLADFDMIRVH